MLKFIGFFLIFTSLNVAGAFANQFDMMITTFDQTGFENGFNTHLFQDENGRFYGGAYSLEGGGCESYLSVLQTPALRLMIARGSITAEEMATVLKLEKNMKKDGVVFISATSPQKFKDILSQAEKDAFKAQGAEQALERYTLWGNAEWNKSAESQFARITRKVTRGTIWVVRGQSLIGNAKYVLPWRTEPDFAIPAVEWDPFTQLEFEGGRGSATEPDIFESLGDQAIQMAVGEAVNKKVGLNRAKFYVHALNKKLAEHYQKEWPFRVRYENPETGHVLLEATLEELYTDQMLLRSSALIYQTYDALKGVLPAHEIKMAIELKKAVLSSKPVFLYKGSQSTVHLKYSPNASILLVRLAYKHRFPQLNNNQINLLVTNVIQNTLSMASPVIAGPDLDPLHMQIANVVVEKGAMLQNLSEAEAARDSNYAITAVKAAYLVYFQTLHAASVDLIESNVLPEYAITVATSSKLIKDQLLEAGGTVQSFYYQSPKDRKIENKRAEFYEITFDREAMNAHAPTKEEALRLLDMLRSVDLIVGRVQAFNLD